MMAIVPQKMADVGIPSMRTRATYLALVDHSGRLVMRDGLCYPQQYRYGEKVAKHLFRPARWVDLQVRHCLDDDK